jgi:AraC-like DNA-binding protein
VSGKYSSLGIGLKRNGLTKLIFKSVNKNQKPSDVYLEVGFEDLSHFSFVFKKEFGKTPSEVATEP